MSSKAFTLIELLVVIVLISIIATFSTLAFHVGDHFQQAKNTARHLRDVISLAQEEAVSESALLSLAIDAKGYQVFRYVDDHWEPFSHDKILGFSAFEPAIVAKLHSALPKIFFQSDGEITPFTLDIYKQGASTMYRLEGKANGEVHQIQLPRRASE
jgi:type II secretion system protein H